MFSKDGELARLREEVSRLSDQLQRSQELLGRSVGYVYN